MVELNNVSNTVTSGMVAVMIGLIIGGVTLLASLYLLPEIQLEIDEIDNDSQYEGVIDDIPGYSLLTNIGPLVLAFGAVIGTVLVVLAGAVLAVLKGME